MSTEWTASAPESWRPLASHVRVRRTRRRRGRDSYDGREIAMTNDEIRTILERNVRAVTLRPTVGQNTARTHVRLKPGLECEVTEGAWRLTIAMSEKSGGMNAGPNPGVLGRGALGS